MQEKKQTGEQNQVLAGRNPVLEALRSGRELECIYIQSGSPKGPVAAILNKAREQGIPVKEATREKLSAFVAAGHGRYVSLAEQALDLGPEDWLDMTHLTPSGNDKLTQRLAQELAQP